jgi:type II restriction enzyme
MKKLNFYTEKKLNSIDDVFNFFFKTLIPENRTWDYFVNWEKVFGGIDKFKIELNILNSLCGSKDFKSDFTYILKKYPEVISVFPLLLGIRENKISVLDLNQLPEFNFLNFDFNKRTLSDVDILKFYDFFELSGIKKLIIEGGLISLKDYTFGVEVGLDTNGRKNRGGSIMEKIVGDILKSVYNLSDNQILGQCNSSSVKQKWGIDLPVDKSERRPDYVIYKNNKLFWVETNFYSGGGSKLKSTCGEYQYLYDFCKSKNVELIWITDGNGWNTTIKPLKETFIHTDYIFNLTMLKEGVLNEILL